MSLKTGDVIDGKYEIVSLLGEGGMGAVYEGLNTRIHRKVAIKVLHGNVASNADAVKRFEREAQAAGRIGSKHIVEVLDLGDLPGGDRYMVMEYLDGEDLTGRIKSSGKLSPAQVYPIAVQVLEGLGAAHEAGIIHRDLKPDNIYLQPGPPGQTDFVKILDFGISKFNSLGGEFSMTQTGAVMGTPYYMSPEQAKGSRELDQRTDLYAVGVIMYECLTGGVPFSAETFNELLFKIVLEEPPPLQMGPDPAAQDFGAIVQRAMARDVAERYQSAAEMRAALHAWAQSSGVAANPAVRHLTPHTGVQLPADTRLAGTTSTWTSEEDPAGLPTKRGNGVKTALVAGALLLVGGGAFALVQTGGGSEAGAETEAAQVAEEQATQAAHAAKEREQLDAEREAMEEERQRMAKEKAEAERAKQEAERLAREAAQQKAVEQTSQPAPRQQPAPRPSPPPSPAPEPQDTGKTSSGRTIRTTF